MEKERAEEDEKSVENEMADEDQKSESQSHQRDIITLYQQVNILHAEQAD